MTLTGRQRYAMHVATMSALLRAVRVYPAWWFLTDDVWSALKDYGRHRSSKAKAKGGPGR